MRRVFLFIGIILALSMWISSSASAENIIMVDDFNDAIAGINTMGYWTGWGSSGNFSAQDIFLHKYNPEQSKNNFARKMTYSCVNSGSFAWHSSNMWDDTVVFDASEFDYISFRLKREHGNDGCYLKIRYGRPGETRETNTVYVGDYAIETTEWQQVNIPFAAFPGLDRTRIQALVHFYDSSLPVNEGAVYIDNLELSKGYVKTPGIGPVRIDASDTLTVNGKVFTIKSVGYQPYSIGAWPGSLPQADFNTAIYDRDLPLISDMGCNTIRTWGEPSAQLIAKAEEYELKVLAGFWIDPSTNYSDIISREDIKLRFRDFVNLFKNSPAILMWCIGNENNYTIGFDAPGYYGLANELGKIAYEEEGELYHPVIIVNGGLYWMGVAEAGAEDMQLNYIDAWGSNLYARQYLEYNWIDGIRDIFEVLKEKTDKPLVVTEFGIDAFRTLSIEWDPVEEKFVAVDGYEDEAMQADWDKTNMLEILNAGHACLGGSLMEYSDEWWKDMTGSFFDHDLGGMPWWDGNQADDYSNEEYYGIVAVAPDGTWEAPDGIDDIRIRRTYYDLQDVFGAGSSRQPVFYPVDDYNDAGPNTNSLGFWTGGNVNMSEITNADYDGSKCRKFSYSNNNWYASNTRDGVAYLDMSGSDYLSFAIKGARGGESMRIEVQYGTNAIASVDFSDTTTTWQKVTIPLDSFAGLDKTIIRAVSIVFSGKGVIYLDNLGFADSGATAPPQYSPNADSEPGPAEGLMVDDYNDDNPLLNTMGYWTGSGVSAKEINEDSYDGTKYREFSFSNGTWYAANVWDGITYADVNDYTNLSFALKGGSGNESFVITIYYGAGLSSQRAYSSVTKKWQDVSISLSDFNGLNKTEITYIRIWFNKTGVICMDNLRFSN